MNEIPFTHSGFLQQLAAGRLAAARCRTCQALLLPPRSLCPHCYSAELEWLPLSGRGLLLGFATIYVGLPTMAAAGYDRQHPYCSGVVRLAEGPAISAMLLDEHGALPSGLRVGQPVRAVFDRPGLLTFVPT
jgi:uncharacterized OB-fold protein